MDAESVSSPISYRVANIPITWNAGQVLHCLRRLDPSVFPTDDTCDIGLFPSAYSTRTKTAVVIANGRSKILEKSNYVPVEDSGGKTHLNIDSSFFGMTPLNDPGDDCAAELVSTICNSVTRGILNSSIALSRSQD